MAAPSNRRDAHITAMRAARDAARELRLEDSPWVDPFEALVRAGALLVFQPLKALFGAYLPKSDSDAPGVLINVKHPLNLQRYTAAHELGHLWMGHQGSIDSASEILGLVGLQRSSQRNSLVEVAAEVFAAHLLMPLNRILPKMTELGVSKQDLREPEVPYSLSLWFGVSYSAMVHQLESLKQIDRSSAQELLRMPPKAIKRAVLSGDALDDWHAGVWPLTARESGLLVHARVGDEFAITLPSHAAGGYLWDTEGLDPAFELVVSENPWIKLGEESAPEVIGGPAIHRARIRVRDEGEHGLELSERRPWQPAGTPASEFHLRVVGLAQPTAGIAQQIRRQMVSA